MWRRLLCRLDRFKLWQRFLLELSRLGRLCPRCFRWTRRWSALLFWPWTRCPVGGDPVGDCAEQNVPDDEELD